MRLRYTPASMFKSKIELEPEAVKLYASKFKNAEELENFLMLPLSPEQRVAVLASMLKPQPEDMKKENMRPQ